MSILAGLLILGVSAALTPERVDAGALTWLAGECPARAAGAACAACGLTHSFTAAAAGRWSEAAVFHAWGPPLFLTLLINTLAGLVWIGSALRRWRFRIADCGLPICTHPNLHDSAIRNPQSTIRNSSEVTQCRR